jgi:hypothetical protein
VAARWRPPCSIVPAGYRLPKTLMYKNRGCRAFAIEGQRGVSRTPRTESTPYESRTTHGPAHGPALTKHRKIPHGTAKHRKARHRKTPHGTVQAPRRGRRNCRYHQPPRQFHRVLYRGLYWGLLSGLYWGLYRGVCIGSPIGAVSQYSPIRAVGRGVCKVKIRIVFLK